MEIAEGSFQDHRPLRKSAAMQKAPSEALHQGKPAAGKGQWCQEDF
jgi:hypothetical protein